MSDRDRALTVALFAAKTGRHVTMNGALTGPQWERFKRSVKLSEERASLVRQGFAFFAYDDLPESLQGIQDAPVGLFVRGDYATTSLADGPRVGIVGARACSGYGAAVARTLARDLAAEGCVIVSGLARGIDAEAHRGALDADGRTIAVLGCGIDRDYPASHAELSRRITETGGLIVSEYAPSVEPAPWRFPARNRIIAGLVDVLVVVEARTRSGALITADLAMEEKRPVLAVPGEITSALSEGTNDLLRLDGVTVCTGTADVLSALALAAE